MYLTDISKQYYNDLLLVYNNIINESKTTGSVNFSKFIQNMELKFKEYGFRDRIANSRYGYSNNEKILILRTDCVGDFICTSAAIRELRMNYPHAFITLVVSERVKPLAELCPYVNEILTFNKIENPTEMLYRSMEFAYKYLWSKHYDLAISFRYWTQVYEHMLLYLSGARERLGYYPAANQIYFGNAEPLRKDWRLTHPVQQPKEIVHDTHRSLYLLQSYGMKILRTDCEVWYSSEDYYQMANLLKNFAKGRLKIAVGIGAGDASRHYPIEKYLEAFKKIVNTGVVFIIVGGPSESADAKFLQENLPSDCVKNLVDLRLGFRLESALIAQCDLYIGNNTGTMHISAALHVPVIALDMEAKDREMIYDRGMSVTYSQYYPYNNATIILRPEHQMGDCAKVTVYSGCVERSKPHCITQIEPEEIVSAFQEMIYFMKFSKIKRIGFPVTNNSLPNFNFHFEFD